MKYLVTGGAGFIGSNLLEELIKENEVVVIDSFNDYYDSNIKRENIRKFSNNPNFKLYKIDLLDKEELSKVFSNEKYFDLIIHLAGAAGVRPSIDKPGYYYQENVISTINILEEMKKYDIKNLIYFSSSSVYGNSKYEKFKEDDITDFPISPYAASKKSAELIIYNYHNNYKINSIILRPFTVYGPKMRPDLAINKFLNLILNDKEVIVYGDGNQERDYTYIEDLISALRKAIDYLFKHNDTYEIINVASSNPVTVNEVLEIMYKKLNKDKNIVYQDSQLGDVLRTYGDITKAKELLNWSPNISFEKGIEKYIIWYQQNKKPKILVYTMGMTKGGTERVIANLSNYLINNYNVTIVTNIKGNSSYFLDNRIKYINIDDKEIQNNISKVITKLSYKRSKKLKKIIEEEKPDLVLSALPEASIRALSIKKYFNVPFITAIRNTPKHEFNYPFAKIIRNYYYKKSSEIIIQDESYLKYLPKSLYNKITVIPNYISKEFCSDVVVNEENIITTVSRLEKQKNIPLLIRAFAKINKKFKNYELYIYGEGRERKKIEKLIRKFKLENKVHLEGNKDNISKCLAKSKLFVLSSNYEGFPNALIEAMSIGIPSIATNSTNAISKIINNNINGITTKKGNKRQLVNKIEYLLINEEERKKIGRNAKKIKEIYNEEDIIKRWLNVIKKYISE